MGRLVIDGEEVYELDEECLKEKSKKQEKTKESTSQKEKKNQH